MLRRLLSASIFTWFRKNSPLALTLCMCVALMFLVMEQGRVIQAQKSLIRQLFQDSMDLTALRLEQAQTER
jgi:hypothetical protein